jgi:hypothetical protein
MNGSIPTRTAALLAAVIPAGIALIVTVVLLVAPAAHAAPAATGHPIQFSDDGISWSDSYTRALFAGVLLVPGGSTDRAFYVKNNSGEPAVLRVTLYGVATTDTDLAAAMSIATSTPSMPGGAVAVTDARPCATLSQGQVLAAGQGIRLDNVASLADVSGSTGQTHQVSFKIAVSLSSTDAGAPAPDSCPTDFDNTVVGSPDPGTGTGSHPVYHLGAGGWTPAPPTASTPTPSATPTAPATPTPSGPGLGTLVGNTERFYQENTVALWLAMAVIGALVLVLVRRRRPDDDDPSQHHPYSRQPTTQIGTGR